MTIDLKEEDFNTKVIENELKPVVVEVWTASCHNCKTLEPILQASATEFKDQADFYKLKADENIELAKSLKIFAVPTLLFYRHGVLIAKKTGVRSQKSIGKILSPLFSFSHEEAKENQYKGLFKRLFG